MATAANEMVTIRKCIEEDIPQICEVGCRVFSTTYGHGCTPDDLKGFLEENYSTSSLTEQFNSLNKHIIIATVDKAVVGFAMLMKGTTEPCIAHLPATVELQRIVR